ncbi:MAG: DUF1549 domain-containing protein [Pirellulaceae bacterium]
MSAFVLLLTAITAANGEATVNFDNHVIPVLTKAGCNTGACHGAAVGRGGFRLSLYGGDPAFDYRSIVLELEGRRVNLAHPDESLIVLKSTESIDHGGGYILEDDGPGAARLIDWIRQGALRVAEKRLEQFQVTPQLHVAEGVGATLQLKATARFSDGSAVDVTRWTVFKPEDASAVEVHPDNAVAKLLRRGRHIVVARYLDHVVPLELVVPLSDTTVDLSKEPRANFVDRHVLDLLSTLRVPVSPSADEATFLRRVTLDLTGRLPSTEIQNKYLESSKSTANKRRELVDSLLNSDEFIEYWTLQLARLLRIRSQPQDTQGALSYHRWVTKQLTDRVPYDQMAREMITALGDTHEVGPANFHRTAAGPREQAEFTSELFMGNRLRCANCHNHPLDRWTQDDYHGLSAIFSKLTSGRVIEVNARGEVMHPRTGKAAVARIPGERFLDDDSDGRQALATWLTDRNNPYFAKAIVNRLWKAMMGRGLVEPTDDLRATNPATHPALLADLAEDFVEHRYDLRHTLRRIALSAAYERTATPLPKNRGDDRYYSHAMIRPLEPEVLADAIADVTGISDEYGNQPMGTRAVSLFDPQIDSETLDILGRCSRVDSCEMVAGAAGGLTVKLHMFNGPLLNGKISNSKGRLARLVADGKTPAEIVDEFYRRALGRPLAKREREFWNRQFHQASTSTAERELLEDFVWSLLTCREFVTNH